MNYSELKQLLTLHEGIRPISYKDTRGKRTIGVGFNLDSAGAKETFLALFPAANYTNIYNGKVGLTSDQIQALFDHCIAIAVVDATALVPSFDHQPEQAQLVLIDMIYNLGKGGLQHFTKFLAAIESEHYAEAIAALTNSLWYHQTGHRAQDDIALLTQIANYRSFTPGPSNAPA